MCFACEINKSLFCVASTSIGSICLYNLYNASFFVVTVIACCGDNKTTNGTAKKSTKCTKSSTYKVASTSASSAARHAADFMCTWKSVHNHAIINLSAPALATPRAAMSSAVSLPLS